MMYKDGSVSKNVRYKDVCKEKFREAFKYNKNNKIACFKVKLNWTRGLSWGKSWGDGWEDSIGW